MDPYKDLRLNRSHNSKSFDILDWNPGLLQTKSKSELEVEVDKMSTTLSELHYKLYAENRRSVLVILQGIDAAGKDGTIRHVMKSLNPQSCSIKSYKKPNDEELSHDYLWRIHKSIPVFGHVGIFNRSHYEDLIEPIINNTLPKKIWKSRIRQVNEFERYLSENSITILKLFLYISKDEQKKRLLERIHDPNKHWKFSEADLLSHKNWNNYMKTYSAILEQTNKKWAPWYIIPSNTKYFRNWAVSSILLKVFEIIDPKFPIINIDPSKYLVE